jgi:HSP20 family protein
MNIHLIRQPKAMNAILDWNPVRELEQFQNRILGAFRPVPSREGNGKRHLVEADWHPAVNITEDEKEYLITAELPEVALEDVKLTLENGVLSIKGERKHETESKNKKHHLVERFYGSFERSFTLPVDADPNKVNAGFKDGVLKISVAKSEAARPKQIEVHMG